MTECEQVIDTVVKCEVCREMQEDYASSKQMQEIFGDKDRSFSWTVSIDTNHNGAKWVYRFNDARGDVSIHDIAMLIKLFLDSGSYGSKLIKDDTRPAQEKEGEE